MFNRIREVDRVTHLLISSPKLTVVTGPVNSGKSKLIDYVIENLSKKTSQPVPIHTVNLRQGTYNSVQDLVDSLSSDKITTWVNKIKETVDEVAILTIKFHIRQDARTPLGQLNILLKRIADELPSYTLLKGKQQPVFFIDEANRLRSLLCDRNGQAALESLFQWFVMHTKEKRNFHVIMASSDSFFNLWVEKFIGASRYNTYVLGHLNKSEALKYWESKVVNDSCKPPKFEDVFSACGGSMFLMNLYWEEYCEEGGGGLIGEDPCNFSIVLQEQRKLCAAFEPSRTLIENDLPKWTRSALVKTMEMLVNSEFGVVKYSSACQELGKAVVHSMMEYNLIHMRPTSRLSFDIPSHSEPVITLHMITNCNIIKVQIGRYIYYITSVT